MKKSSALIFALAVMACGCASKPKVLVVYYSQTGKTKAVAEEIQHQLGADIVELKVQDPYPDDFMETVVRGKMEIDSNRYPALVNDKVDVSQYDMVFIGYPVWFGTYAPPITMFLRANDLSDKTIVPFATFGSGGLRSSSDDLRKACPNATVKPGFGIRAMRMDALKDELTYFLVQNDYIKGDKIKEPEYSDMHELTDADSAVFQEAAGDYKMVKPQPVSVATRKFHGTQYHFRCNAPGPDGSVGPMDVYITQPESGKAFFTLMER